MPSLSYAPPLVTSLSHIGLCHYTGRPYFTQSPSSVGVADTAPAQLQCSGAGLPPPTITWWKLSGDVSMATQVQPSSSVVISGEYLVIMKTSVSDRGYYYCNLSSPLGVITSPQAYLNVYGKSFVRRSLLA